MRALTIRRPGPALRDRRIRRRVLTAWSRSPLSLVGNVTTPTMIITGEVDWRTPMSEIEQYSAALKLEGVPTARVPVPEASHGIASPRSQLLAKVTHILGWFDRYATREGRPVS